MPRSASSPSNPSAEVHVLCDFTAEDVRQAWTVVDDGVMGGRSRGNFSVTDEGHGRFFGEVSLENNGGFSSVRYDLPSPLDLRDRAAFTLRLRGDGKAYSFRVQRPGQRHAYSFTFPTKVIEEWETVTIPFDALEATYRGNPVDVPNYAGETIESLRFLIGNGKAQTFEFMVDEIAVI